MWDPCPWERGGGAGFFFWNQFLSRFCFPCPPSPCLPRSLDKLGILAPSKLVHRNLNYDELREHEAANKEGQFTANGTFCVDTGVWVDSMEEPPFSRRLSFFLNRPPFPLLETHGVLAPPIGRIAIAPHTGIPPVL